VARQGLGTVAGKALWSERLPAFLGILALTRIGVLAATAVLVGGDEFTNDVPVHLGLIHAPFDPLVGLTDQLVGAEEENAPYPPLLGLVEAMPAYPLQLVLPDFYAMRLTYIGYELLTAAFFWLAIRPIVADPVLRHRAALAFVVLPMGWVTSAVMAQDEVIAACWLALALWLAASGRHRGALLACGAGIVAGKIFLAIPLVALVVALPVGRIWTRAVAALAIPAVVYGWVIAAAAIRGKGAPLLDFTPTNEFGINAWVLLTDYLDLSNASAKDVSNLLCAVACVALVALYARRRDGFTLARAIALSAAMLLWVFVLFYHVNPEYYVMLLPLTLALFLSWLELALTTAVFAIAWGINVLYGVKQVAAGEAAGGRQAFVDIYDALSPLDAADAYPVLIWIGVAVTVGLALHATRVALASPERSGRGELAPPAGPGSARPRVPVRR
jgi:hypothetical protein